MTETAGGGCGVVVGGTGGEESTEDEESDEWEQSPASGPSCDPEPPPVTTG